MITSDRSRRRKLFLWGVAIAVLVPAGAWAVGVRWQQCLLLGSAVLTIWIALHALGEQSDEPEFPPLEDSGRDEGARRDVSRLSWAMTDQESRVGGAPFHRARALAVNRLSFRGIDLVDAHDHQAARRLLGDLGYQVLIGEVGRPPTQAVFQQCLGALERLDTLNRNEYW